jgi:hypothetical protein
MKLTGEIYEANGEGNECDKWSAQARHLRRESVVVFGRCSKSEVHKETYTPDHQSSNDIGHLTALKRDPNDDRTNGSEGELAFVAISQIMPGVEHQSENSAPKDKIPQALNTYVHRLHATPHPIKGQEVER